MNVRGWTGGTGVAISVLLIALSASPAAAASPEKKCGTAIRKGAGTVARYALRALQQCEQKVLAETLPAGTDCATHPTVQRLLDHGRNKIISAVSKGCGGRDRFCDGADDVALASVGWDRGSCPDLGGGLCAGPITTCADIPACLTCIATHASAATIGLAFSDVVPDPTLIGLRKCRTALVKAAAFYTQLKRKRLAKCWTAFAKLTTGSLCPTNVAERDIAKARTRLATAVCKACGGVDGRCNGIGDLSPAAVGFPATCPDVTPSGAASCARPVVTLADLGACLTCVSDYHADCADRSAVPSFVPFPPACGTLAAP